MNLSKEAIQLELLRQRIEDAEFQSGDTYDYLNYTKVNEAQKKQAENFIAKKNAEAEMLKRNLHELIQNSSRHVIEEWVEFHTVYLQKILQENGTDLQAKARLGVARETLQEWEAVRQGNKHYVGINWHFLKDYKAAVRKTTKAWWKFWK
jgi:hypothetical protein